MPFRHAPLLAVALLAGCAGGSPGSSGAGAGGSGGTSDAPEPPEPPLSGQFPIVFVSPRVESFGQLFVMSAEGGDAQRLGDEFATVEPAWSPDGTVVAFRRVSATARGFVSQFELMSVSGGERVVLAGEDAVSTAFESSRPHGSLAWSPDGDTLAFASPREAADLRIWLTPRAGGELRLAVPELEAPHYAPSFMPNAPGTLAYVAEAGGTSDIWLVELDRPSERQNLTLGRGPVYGSLRWSPDGDRLAFTAFDQSIATDPKGRREIYVITLATLELTRVTEDAFDDLDPAWSPDGLRLLFSSDRHTRSVTSDASAWLHDLFIVTLAEPERIERLSPGIGGDIVMVDWYWPRSGT